MEGHYYSSFEPSLSDSGVQILGVAQRPTPDPFLGVRESMILPLRVERDDSDLVHYFISPTQVANVINNQLLWVGHSVSSGRIYQVARPTSSSTFVIKGFIMSKVSREEYLD